MKKYIKPEIEIHNIATKDIIRTSGVTAPGGDNSLGEASYGSDFSVGSDGKLKIGIFD